jgi:hypothetical protein
MFQMRTSEMCRRMLFCLFAALLPVASQPGRGQETPPSTLIVEGTVTNAVTGAPLAGARVKLCGSVPSEVYARTDAAGKYRFTAHFPGGYWLDAEQPGFLTPDELHAHFSIDRSAMSPGADGNMHAVVPIGLTAYAVITGRVTSPDGLPLERYPVSLLRKGTLSPRASPDPFAQASPDGQGQVGPVAATQADDRGEFRFGRIVPGTYYVTAPVNSGMYMGAGDPAYRPTYYPQALDLASAKPLELAPGQQFTADIQILRQAGVRVAGRFTGPGGVILEVPQAYAQVMLIPADSQGRTSNRFFGVAKDGGFEIKDVPPGKYELLIYLGQAGLDSKLLWGGSQHVETGRQDAEHLTMDLQRLSETPGVVTFPKGCIASPVHITGGTFGFRSVQTTSAMDGTFTLPAMVPGHAWIDRFPGLISATLDGRDILGGGFEYPPAEGATLRLAVSCGNGRIPQ